MFGTLTRCLPWEWEGCWRVERWGEERQWWKSGQVSLVIWLQSGLNGLWEVVNVTSYPLVWGTIRDPLWYSFLDLWDRQSPNPQVFLSPPRSLQQVGPIVFQLRSCWLCSAHWALPSGPYCWPLVKAHPYALSASSIWQLSCSGPGEE